MICPSTGISIPGPWASLSVDSGLGSRKCKFLRHFRWKVTLNFKLYFQDILQLSSDNILFFLGKIFGNLSSSVSVYNGGNCQNYKVFKRGKIIIFSFSFLKSSAVGRYLIKLKDYFSSISIFATDKVLLVGKGWSPIRLVQ